MQKSRGKTMKRKNTVEDQKKWRIENDVDEKYIKHDMNTLG